MMESVCTKLKNTVYNTFNWVFYQIIHKYMSATTLLYDPYRTKKVNQGLKTETSHI
jgi:hypothetical protein